MKRRPILQTILGFFFAPKVTPARVAKDAPLQINLDRLRVERNPEKLLVKMRLFKSSYPSPFSSRQDNVVPGEFASVRHEGQR